MDVEEIFEVGDQQRTVELQNALIERGPIGQVAFGLFRAQKRSTKAKTYRRSLRRQSYDAKEEALKYLDKALAFAPYRWGWKRDPAQEVHCWVLYVDVQGFGQCSFHALNPASETAYKGNWDKTSNSAATVVKFCKYVLLDCEPVGLNPSSLMPFGANVGKRFAELEVGYLNWLAKWDGLSSWAAVETVVKELLKGNGDGNSKEDH